MKPKYAIVNETDQPCAKHICQLVNGKYYYMARKAYPELKRFDGMRPDRPTSMQEFGFAVLERGNTVTFVRVASSVAKYHDGETRKWQDNRTQIAWSKVIVRKRK